MKYHGINITIYLNKYIIIYYQFHLPEKIVGT
jgi:hypothetical protein